jgi:hypothetical protein
VIDFMLLDIQVRNQLHAVPVRVCPVAVPGRKPTGSWLS